MGKGNSQKLSYEFVKNGFKERNLTLLEDYYSNNHTPMKYQCDVCGYIDSITWISVKHGSGCKKCGIQKNKDKQKLNIEFVRLEFKRFGFTLLEDDYINSGTLMKAICRCGSETKISLDSVHRGRGCKICGIESMKEKQKLSLSFIREYFLQFGYELLEDNYINWETKMKYRCPEGHIDYMHWNSFKNGHRCPVCAGSKKKTIEEIIIEFGKYGYEILDEIYINNETPLHYKCPNGHYSKISWANFQSGQRCKYCNESKGEREIYNCLVENNISFIREYRLNDCRDKNPLPFDFAIFQNEKLIKLIEYDGELHFNAVDCFGGESTLQQTQFRDQIKTNYCNQHNIPLLRIPYWDFNNIEKILDNFLLLKNNQMNIEHETG